MLIGAFAAALTTAVTVDAHIGIKLALVGALASAGVAWRLIVKQHEMSSTRLNQENQALREALEQTRREARKAAHAMRSKDRFFASMSHELRTPLNAIIGYAELISEDLHDGQLPDDSVTFNDLTKLRDAGEQLRVLIDDVLDLSKAESKRLTLHKEHVGIQALMREVEATLSPLTSKNANKLEVVFDTRRDVIETDRMRLRQVLLNLGSNAAKFTRGGTITLTVRDRNTRESALEFAIADTGIGMTTAQLERVFEPYAQASTSTASHYGGTGLGLALCKQLTGALGGTIEAESTPGEGSIFTVTLPSSAAPTRTTTRMQAVKPAAHTYDVLVIDDDEHIIEQISRHLDKAGFEHLALNDSRDALTAIEFYRPNVVLVDLLMPDINGWQIIEQLQQHKDLREIPIIVMSLLDEHTIVDEPGVHAFLPKPLMREDLVEALGPFKSSSPLFHGATGPT